MELHAHHNWNLTENFLSKYYSAGFVLGKKSLDGKISSGISEDNSNSWEMRATFQNLTYWNHDCLPSQNDELLRAFHWLTVAKAVSWFLNKRLCFFCIYIIVFMIIELNCILDIGEKYTNEINNLLMHEKQQSITMQLNKLCRLSVTYVDSNEIQ